MNTVIVYLKLKFKWVFLFIWQCCWGEARAGIHVGPLLGWHEIPGAAEGPRARHPLSLRLSAPLLQPLQRLTPPSPGWVWG